MHSVLDLPVATFRLNNVDHVAEKLKESNDTKKVYFCGILAGDRDSLKGGDPFELDLSYVGSRIAEVLLNWSDDETRQNPQQERFTIKTPMYGEKWSKYELVKGVAIELDHIRLQSVIAEELGQVIRGYYELLKSGSLIE